ncbi:MAG: Fis family transcriptional regulator [Acidobacteria bacterium]|nr:Fis family transcriptional regulator [Acidobacteriota bacterium]
MTDPTPPTPPPPPDQESLAALERTLFDEAIALALDGAAEEAVSVLREAPHGPDSPEWVLGLARARLARDAAGDRARAREELRVLAEAGGKHAWRAWLQLARDARREGRIDAAAGMLKAALDAFRATSAGQGPGAERLADLLSREVRHLRTRSADATTSDERARTRRSLDASALLRIVEFGKRAATITEPQEVLALVLEEAIALSTMERGFIVLVEGERLELALSRGIDIDRIDPGAPEIAVSRTLVREVVRTGQPAYIEEPAGIGDHPAGASLTDRGIRAVACVPITSAGTLYGVLYVDHRTRARQLDGATAHLLELFAGQAAVALENARAHAARRRALETAQEALRLRRDASDRSSEFEPLVGRAPAMEDLFLRLERILPTEAPVLIRGETGTGKDLVAQIIHRRGPRSGGEYVAFNCAGVPESLLEDQLFGHERGAFTGAIQPHAGLFEVAHRGTLFLDEVGDMSPRMQSALLRVLESGEVRRLGGRDAIEVDVRILAATHRDLEAMVEEGTFRQDLFFRLNVLSVSLPPLRERAVDLPLLVNALWTRLHGGNPPEFAPEAMQRLMEYRWPGNVRELENVLERLIVLRVPRVTLEHLPTEIGSRAAAPTRAGTLREAEEAAIRRAVEEAKGNKALAARILDIDRKTLYLKLKAAGG